MQHQDACEQLLSLECNGGIGQWTTLNKRASKCTAKSKPTDMWEGEVSH